MGGARSASADRRQPLAIKLGHRPAPVPEAGGSAVDLYCSAVVRARTMALIFQARVVDQMEQTTLCFDQSFDRSVRTHTVVFFLRYTLR
jgi:hypothetical protein